MWLPSVTTFINFTPSVIRCELARGLFPWRNADPPRPLQAVGAFPNHHDQTSTSSCVPRRLRAQISALESRAMEVEAPLTPTIGSSTLTAAILVQSSLDFSAADLRKITDNRLVTDELEKQLSGNKRGLKSNEAEARLRSVLDAALWVVGEGGGGDDVGHQESRARMMLVRCPTLLLSTAEELRERVQRFRIQVSDGEG